MLNTWPGAPLERYALLKLNPSPPPNHTFSCQSKLLDFDFSLLNCFLLFCAFAGRQIKILTLAIKIAAVKIFLICKNLIINNIKKIKNLNNSKIKMNANLIFKNWVFSHPLTLFQKINKNLYAQKFLFSIISNTPGSSIRCPEVFSTSPYDTIPGRSR